MSKVFHVFMRGFAGSSEIIFISSSTVGTIEGGDSTRSYEPGRRVRASEKIRDIVKGAMGISPRTGGRIIRLECPDRNRNFIEVLFDNTDHTVHCAEEEIVAVQDPLLVHAPSQVNPDHRSLWE